jgi:CheY-like chemotaxis protein
MTGIGGCRLLVVEDDYLIAADLAFWLEGKGVKVLGPAASVDDALALLRTEPLPDAAILDINLGDERVFPVADVLRAANVPFVFLSGYDSNVIPEPYRGGRCCPKPVDRPRLLRALSAALGGTVTFGPNAPTGDGGVTG